METKTCNACGHHFTPRPQNPNQTYCTDPACQRERRRRWQQQKRRDDADYRDNDGVLYNLDSEDDVPAAINVVRQAYERVTE